MLDALEADTMFDAMEATVLAAMGADTMFDAMEAAVLDAMEADTMWELCWCKCRHCTMAAAGMHSNLLKTYKFYANFSGLSKIYSNLACTGFRLRNCRERHVEIILKLCKKNKLSPGNQ